MTYTEKVLADFDKKFPSHGYNDNAENEFHSQNIKRFLTEKIHQAIAEERERVRGKIWQIREATRNDGQIQHIACYDNLLSSLKEKNP